MRKFDFDQLPYGAYLASRDTIIFNRRYQPIVRITPAAFCCHDKNRVPTSIQVGQPTVTACRPDMWIEHESQVWFYSDENPPHRCAATRQRLDQMIQALPELAAEIEHRGRAAVAR
ncbi:hypothetical protein [Bradyrhizobium sp. ERR14]|uniref:hypothetical protein n=1 Tax=Bradyrhizobium sp. ERR14 TaxID=2663837 RepID=UPI00162027FE|nr:hypothetical protein [Bradyrhizobium sp. ERR14]MBB4391782.1 hypothetical protein [Bradyrhizobium sp. ERR14]